jgi:iron complex outermembrane receptor protein
VPKVKIGTYSQQLRVTLMTSIMAVLAAPLPLWAQGVLEEIIVTARQREETLQDVPVTVTAFTQNDIERAGIERAEDFIALTPGVSIVDAAEVGDAQVNIRGINGARDAENSFALIIDGILHTNPSALNREYSDLAQIEILKGPQGAIYGRNAAAGAIIITTQEPGDEFEASIKVSGAEDSTYYTSVTAGGPLVADKSYYRINANWRESDGYYTNSFLNADVVDDFKNYNVNGRLMFNLSDTTTLDVKARMGEVDAASISFNAAFALPTFAAVLGPVFDPLFGAGFAAKFYEDVNDHNFVFQPNIDPQNDQKTFELSAKLDMELSFADLTAWALFSDVDQSFSADGTSGAFGFFNTEPNCINTSTSLAVAGVTLPAPQVLAPAGSGFEIFGPYTPVSCDGTQFQVRDQNDISMEVRLTSNNDEALRWSAGVYYLNISRQVGVNTGLDLGQGVTPALFVPQTGSNPTEQVVNDDFDSNVFAVFGQLAYDINDDVEVSVALRYDEERRRVKSLVPIGPTTQYIDFNPADGFTGGAPLNPALNPAINPSGVIAPQNETFDQLEPKISLTWDLNDDWTLFGSWGIGFKSGGFNSQGSNATIDLFFNQALGTSLQIDDQFAKETSSSFELGFKSKLMDGRLNFEGAVYQIDVDDMQFFEFFVGPFGLLRIVTNIDEVSISGLELAANALVTENFNLSAGVAFTDSNIDRNALRPQTAGNKSPYTPEWTANIAGNLDFPITADMDFITSVTVSAVGPTWFHTMQDDDNVTLNELSFPGLGTANYARTERDTYTTIDLRLGLQGERWSLVAFAKNITDEEYLEEAIPAPEFGGSFIHPGSLRRAGLEFSYNF